MKFEIHSKARKTFKNNAADIERLLEIHKDLGGDQQLNPVSEVKKKGRGRVSIFNSSTTYLPR
jgi:hypothetical protein